jgi:hypothetical protein
MKSNQTPGKILPASSFHGRPRTCALLASMLLLITSTLLHGQSKTDAQKLSEALQEIEALKARLQQLEGTVRALAPAQAPAPGEAPKAGDPAAGFVKWNELITGKSRFKLYGFLRADAIYDDSRPNNPQVPAFILSEDPTAPAAIASPRNSEDFTLHPKLTRLGIDFTGPEVDSLWGAKTGGKLEIDFYNANAAESRAVPRMRHAYLKLTWDEASFLAGQTSDLISPLFPIVNPDFVMWGAGNLGDRRPQLRGEWFPEVLGGRVFMQGALGLTGADDNQDIGGNGFRDGEASGKPTLQGRLAWKNSMFKKYPYELGVWGHRAWEDTEAPLGASGERDFDSYAIGLDLTLPLYKDIVTLKGELWQGQNLSDVRGGILQGINATTGREVDAQGGWVELGVRPHQLYSLHGGLAYDDPEDGDLLGAATPGRRENVIWYLAVRGYFDPIEIGLDYLHWQTKWVGFGDGVDNRFQTYISYKF